jgi:ribonuclease VapC
MSEDSNAVVVDTSALVALVARERGSDPIVEALSESAIWLPAPVLIEFHLVSAATGNSPNPGAAAALMARLIADGARIRAFDGDCAAAATTASALYGKGNGLGGMLNILDLMVYATAKVMGLPILCAGKDFAATDAILHPASRRD